MTKIGVKFTAKPAECTHLVARQLVRTEKFLCALAVAPFIVTERWAIDSAAANQIQRELYWALEVWDRWLIYAAEANYALDDTENEKKYKVRLKDAIQKVREGSPLFAGKTFYVTSKVSTDVKLLKNVVAANGGTVRLIYPQPAPWLD